MRAASARPRMANPASRGAGARGLRRSSIGSAVAGTRIPIDERSTACWPVTGIDGGIAWLGRPIRAASRRATYEVDVNAGSPSFCGSNSRNVGRSSSSLGGARRSPPTSHTTAVMLSRAAGGARRRHEEHAPLCGTVCGADISSASAGSPTRPCRPSLHRSTRSPRRSSMIDSDGSTSSPTPSACRIARAGARRLVRAVAGREQRGLQRLIARDLDERTGAQHVRARVADGGDDQADRRRRPPPTASCPCRAGRARGVATAWTSWFATRQSRGAAGARTPRDRGSRRVAFISRQITCAASSEATSPPSTPPMPSHTTSSGPRSPVALPRLQPRRPARRASRSPTRKLILVVLADLRRRRSRQRRRTPSEERRRCRSHHLPSSIRSSWSPMRT